MINEIVGPIFVFTFWGFIVWSDLNHIVPEGWDKYVSMLAEACSAKNELILITRFQKIVRLIYDDQGFYERLVGKTGYPPVEGKK